MCGSIDSASPWFAYVKVLACTVPDATAAARTRAATTRRSVRIDETLSFVVVIASARDRCILAVDALAGIARQRSFRQRGQITGAQGDHIVVEVVTRVVQLAPQRAAALPQPD